MTEEVDLGGGRRLAYEVDGLGDEAAGRRTILLLRPLGGSMALWGRFRDDLAARSRVVAFDALGAGLSSGPRRRTSTRGMARDALALLDHLGIEAAHVFGISLGGMVASWLAIDAPARVRRLVLCSTLPSGRESGVTTTLRGARFALSLSECFLRTRRDAAGCIATRILSAHFRQHHPEEAARIAEAMAAEGISRGGMLALGLAAAMHDARARLGRIEAPTLVVCGSLDPLATAASQRRLAAAIAHARLETVPDAGHALALEQPSLLAARVLEFFGL